jgi:hypothetical protein
MSLRCNKDDNIYCISSYLKTQVVGLNDNKDKVFKNNATSCQEEKKIILTVCVSVCLCVCLCVCVCKRNSYVPMLSDVY